MAIQIGQARGASDEREPENAELWHDLSRGNVAALQILYNRHADLALGLACRMLGDRQSAEDVVQESFLQAWRYAGRYDATRGSVRSWLLAIVHHRCIDVLRRRAVRPQTSPWEASLPDHHGPFDTWTEVERRLTRATVNRALLRLPPEQREAITLGYFGGYTHAQIAERLGLPLGTVKGRLRLGLQRLRTLLEGLDESCAGSSRFPVAQTRQA